MSIYSEINNMNCNLTNKKLLILFKIGTVNNKIHEITELYCSKFNNNIDYYYLHCDESIYNEIEFHNNIIKFKFTDDNYESLLIKVIKAFNIFKDKSYTNIMVSNVSSFLNIPVLLNLIDKDTPCLSHQGYNYSFKNKIYNWPSGAGYILNIDTVRTLCDFFNKNNFIENNKLSKDFCDNYPTTDDIFFGYFLYLNNIKITELERCNVINNNININDSLKNYSHFRVKTGDYSTDFRYFIDLYKTIYS